MHGLKLAGIELDRKVLELSRTAPMVLRGQPVGEQGAADRWTAFAPSRRARRKGVPSGALFCYR